MRNVRKKYDGSDNNQAGPGASLDTSSLISIFAQKHWVQLTVGNKLNYFCILIYRSYRFSANRKFN